MFLTLLLATFFIAVATSTLVASLFSRPVKKILDRLVSEELGRGFELRHAKGLPEQNRSGA